MGSIHGKLDPIQIDPVELAPSFYAILVTSPIEKYSPHGFGSCRVEMGPAIPVPVLLVGDKPQIGSSYTELGAVLFEQERYPESLEAYNKAYAISKVIGNQLYMSGLSNLFGQPEFIDGTQVKQVAQLLDNLEPWLREAAPNEPLSVYIGGENPIGRSAGCTLIISRFRSPFSDRSYIGTLGPTRQSYRDVMTLVARAGRELEEVLYS